METRTWTKNEAPVTREKMVAFLGYRTNRIAKFTADHEKLPREVTFDTSTAIESYCIRRDYDTSLSGMCGGFDLTVAEEVLSLKKRYSHICLKCAAPSKGQAERYTQADKQRYDTTLVQANEVVTLQDGHTEGCLPRRNNYLLENSAFLVVYYDTVAIGSTFYALGRVIEQKKEFANICYNRKQPCKGRFSARYLLSQAEAGKERQQRSQLPERDGLLKSKRTTTDN